MMTFQEAQVHFDRFNVKVTKYDRWSHAVYLDLRGALIDINSSVEGLNIKEFSMSQGFLCTEARITIPRD